MLLTKRHYCLTYKNSTKKEANHQVLRKFEILSKLEPRIIFERTALGKGWVPEVHNHLFQPRLQLKKER